MTSEDLIFELNGASSEPSDTYLTPEDVAIYEFFAKSSCPLNDYLQQQGSDASHSRITRLIRLGLLRADARDPSILHAASPGLASADLTLPLEKQARELTDQSERIRREFVTLTPLYEKAVAAGSMLSSTEILTDVREIRIRLAQLTSRVRESTIAAHPTLPDVEGMRAGLELDAQLLRRGVQVRALFTHTVRRYHVAVDHLRAFSSLGAQVRTLAMVPARMVVFDNEVAVIPRSHEGHDGAAVLHEPPVIAFLTRLFEHMWDRASNLVEDQDETVVEQIELEILRELAQGRTDESVARRLGISTRTLRRYTTSLCERLGAASRFQLAVEAMRAGLIQAGHEKSD
jgi:DNA-binding CsgD family transcriptional regulator